MNIGVLALGRPTFDVPYAEEKLAAMLTKLESTGHQILGPRELLFDEEAAQVAIESLKETQIESLLILQVTFTDASMAIEASHAFDLPIAIWAIPEPRQGDRLRLNSFCGLNLASHALSLNEKPFSWIYKDPEKVSLQELSALLNGENLVEKLTSSKIPETTDEGIAVANAIQGKRIGRIGNHPVGFDTSAYKKEKIFEVTGVTVEAMPMDVLFDGARAVDNSRVVELRAQLDTKVENAHELDQPQLERSLRLKCSLDDIRDDKKLDAFAVRCWPETFTEYGGAVCGPAAMLGERKIPCACEADVYGSLTQMLLQQVSDSPVFLTDLVDIDVDDDTAVVWHCGQAPLSMRDPDFKTEATVHTNRKQPLLFQFPLKPGVVTFVRISQAHNELKLVVGTASMLKRPMAYTGTSGVLRFSRSAKTVLNDIIISGLEHHIALTYGDHKAALLSAAGALGIPVLEV